MKHLIPAAIIFLALLTNTSYSQNNTITHIWSATGGLFSDNFGTPTAVDEDENFYRAGFESNGNGGTDVKLQKLDDEGNLLWTTKLNTTSDLNSYEPSKIFIYNNDIYITGILTYFTNMETDFFIAKTDDDGQLDWFITDQSPGNDVSADLIYDDVSDQVIICGTTERSGTYDLLIAAFDDNGSQQWLIHKDYNGNYDGGAKVFRSGNNIAVQGSSQSSPTQWDIVSWFYSSLGAFVTEERTNGLTVSSDELKDGVVNNGYLHLTGSSSNINGTDFKVVCLDANNNYLWSDTYNKNGLTEEGRVVIASSSSFVAGGYVTDANNGENLLIRKYNLTGSLLWNAEFDYDGQDDKVIGILEDQSGNYLILAQITENSQTDVYLYALNGASGSLLWTEAIADDVNLNETAQTIEADLSGKIYITYTINGIAATESFAYSELSYPRDNEPHSKGALFIKNSGQIIDSDGLSAPDIRYYSFGLSPDYFFTDDRISTLVWDNDSLGNVGDRHRIDYNFIGANSTYIGHLEEYQRSTHFNYYVDDHEYELQNTFEAIAWPEIYDDIDVIVSSNSEGFKMTIVLESNADLADFELSIDGANGYNVTGDDLHVQSIVGDIVWMEPFSFVKDGPIEDDDCITYDVSSGNLKLSSLCGLEFPYVIQLKTGTGTAYSSSSIGNLEWSTFYGGNGSDYSAGLEVDQSNGDIFVAGDAISTKFPQGSGIDTTIVLPTLSGEYGLILKFDHDAEVKWASIINGVGLALIFKDVGIFNNIAQRPGKEVHVVGNYVGTFKPKNNDPTFIPSNAWQTNAAPNILESEIMFASFRNDNGTLLIASPFGSPENDDVHGMDIGPGGLMYFYGQTQGTNTFGSSATPPSTWTFPLFDPSDGSYFESSVPARVPGTTPPFRAFVTAMDLNLYELAYSSFIRKDNSSSKSEFEAIFDMEFDGSEAFYCGQAVSGARLGKFDPTQNKFATSLDQLNSEFTDKSYFSNITNTPSGTAYIGMDDDGTTDPFISTPGWRDFQSGLGKAFIMMIDGSNIVWDSYFGDGSNMNFYWHAAGANTLTGTPYAFGKGKLAYNGTKSTFFIASTAGQNPVQTLDHPNFFFESENATLSYHPANKQGDIHLNAFYTDGTLNLANHTWGTMYGGNGIQSTPAPFATTGTEYLADIKTYDFNNKSYVLVASTSFSEEGSATSDDTKYPVADLGLTNSWFKKDNAFIGLGGGIGRADITLSRFEITDISQGVVSIPDQTKMTGDIHIFPLPANDELNVIFYNGKIEQIEIHDISGKKVNGPINHISRSKAKLDVSNLSQGVYTISVNNSQHEKFIIR